MHLRLAFFARAFVRTVAARRRNGERRVCADRARAEPDAARRQRIARRAESRGRSPDGSGGRPATHARRRAQRTANGDDRTRRADPCDRTSRRRDFDLAGFAEEAVSPAAACRNTVQGARSPARRRQRLEDGRRRRRAGLDRSTGAAVERAHRHHRRQQRVVGRRDRGVRARRQILGAFCVAFARFRRTRPDRAPRVAPRARDAAGGR